MTVDVYWNLHKGGYSIRERGKVIGHADEVVLRNARFVVQQAGYERTIAYHRKRVHAVVRGELASVKYDRYAERCVHAVVRGELASELTKPSVTRRVRYNPLRGNYFHLDNGARIDAAPVVWFSVDANGKAIVEVM